MEISKACGRDFVQRPQPDGSRFAPVAAPVRPFAQAIGFEGARFDHPGIADLAEAVPDLSSLSDFERWLRLH